MIAPRCRPHSLRRLIYHCVLRVLPVPAAAIEEAREQGVLSREQYTQLRRISAAMSEGERMADEVETRRVCFNE